VRALVSLEGSREGGTRAAFAHLGFDALHVLATDPDGEAAQHVCELAERLGAPVEVTGVPADDLMGAVETIQEAIADVDGEEVLAQINAGPDANLLSAAGMLACMNEGVPMHFLHEEGHTPLPILSEAPLERLLAEDERDQLVAFSEEDIELDAVDDHDKAALNGLKNRGLIEPDDGRLVLTELGRSYREHLRRR
jgi:hypothetical protein